jgi:AcrR family transcriptional regulator
VVERDKRESILEAATRCFGRWGYKKASVDLIARQAGVGKGTVYLNCDSKEDLFYQAVHRELRSFIGDVTRMIDPRVPANELMMRAAAAHLEFLDKRPLVRDLLFGILHGQLPGWIDRFDELRTMAHRYLVEILELGIRQGIFRPDLDVPTIAEILQEMQIAAILLGKRTRTQGNAPDLDDLAQRQAAGFDLIMKGLEARPA